MNGQGITEVYYGERNAMIAEVSAWDPIQIGVPARECKYLVMPIGEAQYETEWFASKKDAIVIAKLISAVTGAELRRA